MNNRETHVMGNGRTRTYLLKACNAFLLKLLRSAFRVAEERERGQNQKVYSAQFKLCYVLAVKVYVM